MAALLPTDVEAQPGPPGEPRRAHPEGGCLVEHDRSSAAGAWEARVGAEDPPAGDGGEPPPRRRSRRPLASCGRPRCPEAEGGPALGLDRDVDREGRMAAEGDAQGQQTGCEHRGVIPVAGVDVAHGPRRHAGRGRDLTGPRPPDAGRDGPPDRVDVIEAAVQDALGKLATCPPAPPDSASARPAPGRARVPSGAAGDGCPIRSAGRRRPDRSCGHPRSGRSAPAPSDQPAAARPDSSVPARSPATSTMSRHDDPGGPRLLGPAPAEAEGAGLAPGDAAGIGGSRHSG